MTPPDPITDIVALLEADTSVTDLTSLIFGGGLPEGTEMPQAAVIVKPAGGQGRRGYELHRNTRVDTICYGRTLKESWDLHRAVRDVLESLRHPTSTSILWASIASDGANAIDQTTQWPTCFASYTIKSAVEA